MQLTTRLLCAVCLCSVVAASPPAIDYEELASGAWQVYPLPGHPGFVFTMYGCPGEVIHLEELVHVMRDKGLGNGFDPGPSARAGSRPLFEYLATVGWPVICYPGYSDMQVKEGRARLSDADEAAVQVLDQAGVFSAIQLGEWGYYFHNLSCAPSWWQAVYGDEFDTYRHLMKPPPLRGYDAMPASRQECYEVVRDYYVTRDRYMRGRNMSVTGHSHYEAYAAEWGAALIGLELGENIAFTQSKLAFARGASRQWKRPWSVQVSPWFSGSCTTNGPLRMEGKYARGLDAGHSLSFYERLWLHAWFAGAAMVTPENSISIFFENAAAPWKLTVHGEKAAEVFGFTRNHDRGVPYTPVAIVLDRYAGYNAYKGRPWGILENTPGDEETRDLFQRQLFPGSDHIHAATDPENPEASYLRPTPFGELADVLLSTAPGDVLAAYPVLLLVGDIDFEPGFVGELFHALRRGSKLLLHARHADALGEDFERLKDTGEVEVLEAWTNPVTQRPAAIANGRLAKLVEEYLPVQVTGDPVQYAVNRNRQGWVVEIVNNAGVVKTPTQPANFDPAAVAEVRLRAKVPVVRVKEWRTARDLGTDQTVSLTVPPGGTRFVEFTLE